MVVVSRDEVHSDEGHEVGSMSSPLADEEELLRLVTEGKSQSSIAEMKGVSREAVRQRLVKLRPLMEARGIVVHDGRGIRRDKWIPWSSMPERWRQSLPIKRLRLLGRTFDGPPLSEDEQRYLAAFLDKLDHFPPFGGGRGVVDYQGPEVGVRIVRRRPWDRGYVRWPEGVPDTRPLPPELTLPDEPYTDPGELAIWRETALSPEERHALITQSRERPKRASRKVRRNVS
jgi:hypothetical protein